MKNPLQRCVKSIRDLWKWVSLEGYMAEKDRATDEIVARLARNNVLFQEGLIMDESEQLRMSREADDAMRRLMRHSPRS